MNFYHTKAQLKSMKPNGDLVAYCLETNSFYIYQSNSLIPVDDHQVLITGNGGNTRWFSIHYTYNLQSSLGVDQIVNNIRIDTGTADLDNFISIKELNKTITYNTQFSTSPRIILTKKNIYTIGLNDFREANLYISAQNTSGFTAATSSSTASYSNGQYIRIDWIAIGGY